MKYQEVLEAIVKGKRADENAADILMMVHLVEPYIPADPVALHPFITSFAPMRGPSPPDAKVAHIAGTLLCLLFAPVKQPVHCHYFLSYI